jgi:hypothetical protein
MLGRIQHPPPSLPVRARARGSQNARLQKETARTPAATQVPATRGNSQRTCRRLTARSTRASVSVLARCRILLVRLWLLGTYTPEAAFPPFCCDAADLERCLSRVLRGSRNVSLRGCWSCGDMPANRRGAPLLAPAHQVPLAWVRQGGFCKRFSVEPASGRSAPHRAHRESVGHGAQDACLVALCQRSAGPAVYTRTLGSCGALASSRIPVQVARYRSQSAEASAAWRGRQGCPAGARQGGQCLTGSPNESKARDLAPCRAV